MPASVGLTNREIAGSARRSGLGVIRRAVHAMAVFLACCLPATAAAAAAAQEPVPEILRQRSEQLRSRVFTVAGVKLHRPVELAIIYETRTYSPIWTDASLASDLMRSIEDASDDGLVPAHYHQAVILTLASAPPTPTTLADLELLRSDALLELAHDLRFGRTEPDHPVSMRDTIHPDAAVEAARIIATGRINEALFALRPAHYTYRGLMAALARYRRIEERGGWASIPSGPALRLGDTDPRVPLLRRRLTAEGFFAPSKTESDSVFDVGLEAALRRFQGSRSLSVDGVAGPATLVELNVGVQQRIDQLRVNLERARWFARGLPNTFVVVNVAGAQVYVVANDTVALQLRTIVGRAQTRTPQFSASMSHIELNPTWTVPPGIVREVLAEVRRDHGYLRRVGMRVLDRAGRPVEIAPSTIALYSAATFPYVFQQAPGPANPLGQIKFVFPNTYNVYLHDTPSRALFDREQRTFSHGCIRVENPLRLAEMLLNDPKWRLDSLARAIRTGRTQIIPLRTPVQVRVLYWTAAVDQSGELRFYRDVYGRDAAVLRGLDSRR